MVNTKYFICTHTGFILEWPSLFIRAGTTQCRTHVHDNVLRLGPKVKKEVFCVLKLHCIPSHVSKCSLPLARGLSLTPYFRFIPSMFSTYLSSTMFSFSAPLTYTNISCSLPQSTYTLSTYTKSIQITPYTQYR